MLAPCVMRQMLGRMGTQGPTRDRAKGPAAVVLVLLSCVVIVAPAGTQGEAAEVERINIVASLQDALCMEGTRSRARVPCPSQRAPSPPSRSLSLLPRRPLPTFASPDPSGLADKKDFSEA